MRAEGGEGLSAFEGVEGEWADLQERGAALTQHQDVYLKHQFVRVQGDGACPGATVLKLQPGQ